MANSDASVVCPRCNGFMNYIGIAERMAAVTLEVVYVADEYQCNDCSFVGHY